LGQHGRFAGAARARTSAEEYIFPFTDLIVGDPYKDIAAGLEKRKRRRPWVG
jgi:hypothetical protein